MFAGKEDEEEDDEMKKKEEEEEEETHPKNSEAAEETLDRQQPERASAPNNFNLQGEKKNPPLKNNISAATPIFLRAGASQHTFTRTHTRG